LIKFSFYTKYLIDLDRRIEKLAGWDNCLAETEELKNDNAC